MDENERFLEFVGLERYCTYYSQWLSHQSATKDKTVNMINGQRRFWQPFYLLGILASLTLALVACHVKSGPAEIKSYEDARKDSISTLETNSSLAPQPNYRLVAIPPSVEVYKPGTPFKKGLSRPLTHSCLVPPSRLPDLTELPDPVEDTKARFRLEREMPEMVKTAMQEVPDIAEYVKKKREATFTFTDMMQITAAPTDLRKAARNESCLNALLGHGVLMIRGIVYGTEAISSRQTFDVTAKEILLKNKLFRVRYDSFGGYYISEVQPKPKFWIVSEWRIDLEGVEPTASSQERLVALRNYLASSKGDLPISEIPPSEETVKEFLDGQKGTGDQRVVR